MKDKLHLNNQGKDLLARTVTEAVNVHNRKFRAERKIRQKAKREELVNK